MSEHEERVTADHAREALDSIRAMEKAALWKAIPPRRFGAAIALLAGALVALSAADHREYLVFVIIVMSSVLLYQSQKTGVSMRAFPAKVAGIALIILIPLFFLLIIAAQMLRQELGSVGAPLAAGGVLALTVFILSIYERRWHVSRIGSGSGE